MGGYDGDVLFENPELTRTVVSSGGQVVDLPGVFVGRVPPYAGHFRSQRVRQAYDDLAQPARLLLEASVLPLVLLGLRRRPVTVLAGALAAVLLAETGGDARVGRRSTRGRPPGGRCRGWGSGRSASGSRWRRSPGAARRTRVAASGGRPPRPAC